MTGLSLVRYQSAPIRCYRLCRSRRAKGGEKVCRTPGSFILSIVRGCEVVTATLYPVNICSLLRFRLASDAQPMRIPRRPFRDLRFLPYTPGGTHKGKAPAG